MKRSWRQTRREVLISNQWLTLEKNNYIADNQEVLDYFILRRSPFVLVVAETQEGVVLVRQYRPATEQFYWSLPAGYVQPHEDVFSAAARELLEETNVAGRDFHLIGSLDPLPGYISSTAHVVVCSVTKATVLAAHDEIAEVAVRSWDVVAKQIETGEINEMQAVAALLLAQLRRQKQIA